MADEALRAAVIAERSDGTSWDAIGKALGTSRSGAHGRFSPDVNDWLEKHPRTAHEDALSRLDDSWGAVESIACQQLFLNEDRLAETEKSLREAVAEGGTHAAIALAELLVHTDRSDEAEQCLRMAVAKGSGHAVVALADVLRKADHGAEAEKLLKKAGQDGYVQIALAEFLAADGRVEEATTVLRRIGEEGDGRAITALARLLLQTGRNDEAMRLLAEAAGAGNDKAAAAIARLSAAQDPDDLAENLWSVVHFACHGKASALLDDGDPDTALRVLLEADSDRTHYLAFLDACQSASAGSHRWSRWDRLRGNKRLEPVLEPCSCQTDPQIGGLNRSADLSAHWVKLAASVLLPAKHDHDQNLAWPTYGHLHAEPAASRIRARSARVADDAAVKPPANQIADLERRLARVEAMLAEQNQSTTDDSEAASP